MANFNTGYILTTAGQELQAKVEAGTTKLKITRMQFGDGTCSSINDYKSRTALFSPRTSFVAQSVTASGSGCIVKGEVVSDSIDKGYSATELGLFAEDDSGNEVLFSVSYDATPLAVPGKDDGVGLKTAVEFLLTADGADKVEITLPTTATDLVELAQTKALAAADSQKAAAASASSAAASAKSVQDNVATATNAAAAAEAAAKNAQTAAGTFNKDDYYTKTEVDAKIKTAISAIADYDSTAF
nr:MAG TPA: tail collar fiber protein [Caudoviricetes sp.]